ncbi:CrcB family protein [Schumannella sp. 10F1B-5-1]|nr:CrcB family protein [Schumannella sp. 10F1B-5-1]
MRQQSLSRHISVPADGRPVSENRPDDSAPERRIHLPRDARLAHSAAARDSAPELPLDPDTDAVDLTTGRPLPVHLRPASLLLVAAGGTVGTLVRELIDLALPRPDGLPVSILLINVTGALLLGALLEGLARRGPDEGARRRVRLLVGTGVLGGYTTYSALAADSAKLLLVGDALLGLLYPLATLVLGAAASAVGIVLARRLVRGAGA